MKTKILEWLRRYLPAEIIATIGALCGALIGDIAFHNQILTAYFATLGENIGYYTTIIYKEIRQMKVKGAIISIGTIVACIRNLIVEFGPSEILDSFLIRPFSMYFFPKLFNNLGYGIIVGKIVADLIFYIPTIFLYELRKAVIKDRDK